ncbi:head-tail connector protein [Paenibacillus sp. strain BS8-2]
MLATLERLKGIMPEMEGNEDLLTLQIAAASASIEQYCKRSFRKQEYAERISGYASSKYINLRNYPVHEIKGINVEGYELLDEGQLYRRGGWPCGDHNVTVSYIGGYVLPGEETTNDPRTLPKPLELACLLYAQMLLRSPGVKSERVGDISVTYADERTSLPPVVVALISPYVGRWV